MTINGPGGGCEDDGEGCGEDDGESQSHYDKEESQSHRESCYESKGCLKKRKQ